MVLGSCGVMDQGSTFGLQGTPIPSQEEINECTPALLHILRSDPKPLPTSPQTPHVPMPPDVPAPTSPTCTSHLAFSCEALCSCRLWSTSPYPPQILPCSDPCSPVSPVPPTSLSETHICALHLLQLLIPHLQKPSMPQHCEVVRDLQAGQEEERPKVGYEGPGMVMGSCQGPWGSVSSQGGSWRCKGALREEIGGFRGME